jgi:hypothetical protein
VPQFDLFEFYRFMLTVLVSVYGTIRIALFIWHWHGVTGRTRVGSALLYRYLFVLLLRARFRRFAYELITIGGLASILVLLVHLHWR